MNLQLVIANKIESEALLLFRDGQEGAGCAKTWWPRPGPSRGQGFWPRDVVGGSQGGNWEPGWASPSPTGVVARWRAGGRRINRSPQRDDARAATKQRRVLACRRRAFIPLPCGSGHGESSVAALSAAFTERKLFFFLWSPYFSSSSLIDHEMTNEQDKTRVTDNGQSKDNKLTGCQL